MTFSAPTTAAMVREALDALGYRYSRKQGERMFGETVSLDLHERGTTAWRFFVESPASFVVETYDTRPRAKAVLAYLEVHGFGEGDEPAIRRLLRRFADEAPKAPWSFTLDQRMHIGPFHRAFGEARRAWRPVAADEPIASAEV